MTITIPDELSKKLGFNEEEFLLEVAIALFKEEKITLGLGSRLACMHQSQFQKELAKRRIAIHYGIDELNQDLETLTRLNL